MTRSDGPSPLSARIPSPQPYHGPALPSGLSLCDEQTGLKYAAYAIERLHGATDRFPMDMFPKRSLVSCPLLGSYTVHYRNHLYDNKWSLREIIERKINSECSDIYIISVNSFDIYNVFSTDKFSYDYIDFMHRELHSIEFVITSKNIGGMYLFEEDSPACFMSYPSAEGFEDKFMARDEALNLFMKNIEDWRITGMDREDTWVEEVKKYYSDVEYK